MVEKNALSQCSGRGWSDESDVSDRSDRLLDTIGGGQSGHGGLGGQSGLNKRVNIRMTERDLVRLQKVAMQEGLPYQTLVSSILHKFVNGRLVEKVD